LSLSVVEYYIHLLNRLLESQKVVRGIIMTHFPSPPRSEPKVGPPPYRSAARIWDPHFRDVRMRWIASLEGAVGVDQSAGKEGGVYSAKESRKGI